MINPHSIAPESPEAAEAAAAKLHPSIREMAAFIDKMDGVAKNRHTLLAALALGAADAHQALLLAHRVERFIEPHHHATSYRLVMLDAQVIRITAQTPQTNLTPEQLVFEQDMSQL